eukprot:m.58778 g.58778  ORF g.58778 m.58778 type:complete len:1083 (-) comp12898_c0_seq1:1768-5016(-)
MLLSWEALAACLLCVASTVHADTCTADDFDHFLTKCTKNPSGTKTRSEIFYPRIACEVDAATAPKNSYDKQCDCDPGKFREDNGDCSPCTAGEFNPAGLHFDRGSWGMWNASHFGDTNYFSPEPGVTVYCDGQNCQPWTPDADGNALNSGNNWDVHNMRSVIVMVKQFTREENEVKFSYRVDAETCTSLAFACDGLTFFLDGEQLLPTPPRAHVSNQPQYAIFQHTFGPGEHTLKWVYGKDSGVQAGEDSAYIQSITLVGAEDDDGLYSSSCSKCGPGTVSADDGAAECSPCSWFEYQDEEGKTTCKDCQPGHISSPGSAECRPLPNCTAEDYYVKRTPVDQCTKVDGTFMYDETSYWDTFGAAGQERDLCLVTPDVSKPTDKTAAGPCVCQPGMQLDASGAQPVCKVCPPQTYNEGSNETQCSPCPAGTVSRPGTHFNRFDFAEVPAQPANGGECTGLTTQVPFCTSCGGDNCLPDQNGFYPRGDHLSSGRGTGNVDVVLQWPNIQVQDEATIEIACSVDCRFQGAEQIASWDDCYMLFAITNSTDIVHSFECTQGEPYQMRGYIHQVSTPEPLPAGEYGLTATFHQRDKLESNHFEGRIYSVSIDGTVDGGAASCERCPLGSVPVANPGAPSTCQTCGPGEQSNADGTACEPCPAHSFSAQAGQQCMECGAGTSVLMENGRAVGCSIDNGCAFVGQATAATYEIFRLGNDNGDMVFAGQTPQYFGFEPHVFYLNPCYTKHSGQQCLLPNNQSAPYMACQVTQDGSIDIGSVFGFTEVESGSSLLEFAGGSPCPNGVHRHTTVHLYCDVSAGKGSPAKVDGNWQIESPARSCHYELQWYSEFGCPKCGAEDYEAVAGHCSNGIQRVVYNKLVDCAGSKASSTQKCTPASREDAPPEGHVFIVAQIRLATNTEEFVDAVPAKIAAELDQFNVLASDVSVLDWSKQAGTVWFRIDRKSGKDAKTNEIKKALSEVLADGAIGHLEGSVAIKNPTSSSGGISTTAIAGAGAIVGILLIVLGVFYWKNRQLKYQNYQLVQASGGDGTNVFGQLYDDDTPEDRNDFGTGAMHFTNGPAPSNDWDEDA